MRNVAGYQSLVEVFTVSAYLNTMTKDKNLFTLQTISPSFSHWVSLCIDIVFSYSPPCLPLMVIENGKETSAPDQCGQLAHALFRGWLLIGRNRSLFCPSSKFLCRQRQAERDIHTHSVIECNRYTVKATDIGVGIHVFQKLLEEVHRETHVIDPELLQRDQCICKGW